MTKERFPYDRTLRDIIQRLPAKLIEVLTGSRVIKVLDSTFPSVEERRADFIGVLQNGDIIHVELQSQPDCQLSERMVDYALRIKRKYGKFPLPIILWIGEGRVPYEEKCVLGPITFQCRVIDIKQLDCNIFLDSDDPNDNILAVLCRRGVGFWNRLSERLMRLPSRKRQSYMKKLFYLVRLRRDIFEEYERLIKEVTDMPIVMSIEQDPVYLMGIQQGIEKGIKEGIEKGVKEGIEKGLILEAQELIIEAIRARFLEVSEDITKQIGSITDINILKKLHIAAIQSENLETFKKKMIEIA